MADGNHNASACLANDSMCFKSALLIERQGNALRAVETLLPTRADDGGRTEPRLRGATYNCRSPRSPGSDGTADMSPLWVAYIAATPVAAFLAWLWKIRPIGDFFR